MILPRSIVPCRNNVARNSTYKAYGSFLLLMLLVLPASRIFAQKTNMNKSNTLTIGCYNASQMEMAEEICIFENHRFIYSISYGALDQFTKGTWQQAQDTLYLTSDKPAPKYMIQASQDKAVAPGKILLVFAFNYQHVPYLVFNFSAHPAMDSVVAGKETKNGYEVLVDQPSYRHLKILHSMYDTAFFDYPLPPDANKLDIAPGEGLGRLQFNREAFLISKEVLESVTNKDHRFMFSGKPPEEALRYAMPDNK